ncbi:Nif3-like dinuclear metal center hexameric protein [Peptostreptococcus stomatis]|uniref:Nif3-like dinuclear metal center hexameric protein n=1 Tax=Peptostreptococcus stomatis TaxID=341694 RepID=UPI0028D62B00|nr:Nif3-like dinuclear metal center hexameric protein [Peptostreptococcus stomatis]
MKLRELLDRIRLKYPEELQYSWDNSSLNLGDLDQDINKIMLTLEITNRTIDEAIEKGVDLVISHHPFLMSKVNQIRTDTIKGGLIYKMIRNNISAYCMHTSYDMAEDGLNDYFFDLLGIKDRQVLDVESSLDSYNDGKEYGLGRLADLEKPIEIGDLISILKEKLNIDQARYVGPKDLLINKIAVVTGNGSEFFQLAKSKGCDILITGDLKYHQAMDALDIDMALLDFGHYGTEHIFSESVYNYINSISGDIEVLISERNIDPFTFV